jgi:hypothetical protein
LWEGEGEGIETKLEMIPQQKGSAPHQMQVWLRYTVLAREFGQGSDDAARAADSVV